MIAFRQADNRFPPLWEDDAQPAARWHAADQGPVQYFADTPDGAWAEFLRHEEITDPDDLVTIERALWAMEIPETGYAEAELPRALLTGGVDSYAACREEARRLMAAGAQGIQAPSAALKSGGAAGWRVEAGLQPGPERDGWVQILFGSRPDLVGWRAAVGRPTADLLPHVRHLTDPPQP
jgi:hypothetical protein